MTSTIKLALDWTPNANHIGFYVGLEMGWYKDIGIDLIIESPSQSYNINETPARRLMKDEVDLCICPTESLISCWTSNTTAKDHRPQAIATILTDDTSAIASLKSSNVSNIKDLDNKKYASYQGRFEMDIIKQMIKNAGGSGDVVEVIPSKLDCFDTVLRGEADATWIFCGWEGIIAKHKNIGLNIFPVSSSGVPYGYSPILLASSTFLMNHSPEIIKQFLAITARGYEYSIGNPSLAATCLLNVANHETLDTLGHEFITETIAYLGNRHHFIDPTINQWGIMSPTRWVLFNNWLFDNQLITTRDGKVLEDKLPIEQMFTNTYLNY